MLERCRQRNSPPAVHRSRRSRASSSVASLSAIARLQLRALFIRLLARYPHLEVADPVYSQGNFIDGIFRMPMTLGRAA